MFSSRDFLFNSTLHIRPQNILLSCSNFFIYSVLTPLSALQNFLFHSAFGEYFRGNHFTGVSFRQCLNMNGPAEHFIHQEQRGNCSRIRLCNYQSYAKTSSLVMQNLPMPHLTPHVLVKPHSRWETHLVCEIQVALSYTTFSVSEISVLYSTSTSSHVSHVRIFT